MRFLQKNDTPSVTRHADFPIKDEKGRPVGVLTSRYEFDAVEATDEDCRYGYFNLPHIKPGRCFAGRVQATRNGVSFGASQPFHYFGSAEARDAWIAQQVEATRGRYARKYAEAV